ncbi:HORMA domain-containing protein 2 [Myotis davidii]|uniref:HORMA domain-containing protein 2 n=1 Tax=Myotis davidii TaxID=225400 RepID=L5LZN7_MYODS|nr:HORMA domain-containing protein 2 [Myotis davidii]
MYGEEPVLTCVTFLMPQQSWLEASSPKSVTLGALSLLQGTSPTYRQMRLAFGGRKVYVVLRQLHMAILTLYPNPKEPEKVTEIYQFKFKYTNEGITMDFDSSNTSTESGTKKGHMKKASILLLRKLYILMQNLGPLPNDVVLTMKLHYYTPDYYQPPGFKHGVNSHILLFEGEPVNLQVGVVSTGFHSMKLKVITEATRVSDLEDNLFQENSVTEMAHQGLDGDEEEEGSNNQREEGREKEKEKHWRERETDQLPAIRARTGDQTHNPGMCPDGESSPQPFVGVQGSENEYCVQSAKLREHQEEEEGQRTIGSHHPREQSQELGTPVLLLPTQRSCVHILSYSASTGACFRVPLP